MRPRQKGHAAKCVMCVLGEQEPCWVWAISLLDKVKQPLLEQELHTHKQLGPLAII